MFAPKHIPLTGVKQMYGRALEQVEAAEMEAWINYQRCLAARKAVEEDMARTLAEDKGTEETPEN